VKELLDHGEVSPVWLGIELQELDAGLAAALHLPEGVGGALVSRVRASSPAERAGIRRGDVLTQVAGQPIEVPRTLFERLESTTAGQQLVLTALREGQKLQIPVRAEPIPEDFVAALVADLLGLELEPAPRGGFAVSRVRAGSGAAQIGLRPGDVLLAIGGRPLNDAEALRRAVLGLQGHPRALIVVARGSGRYHVALPLAS
jgi:serine protease Do